MAFGNVYIIISNNETILDFMVFVITSSDGSTLEILLLGINQWVEAGDNYVLL